MVLVGIPTIVVIIFYTRLQSTVRGSLVEALPLFIAKHTSEQQTESQTERAQAAPDGTADAGTAGTARVTRRRTIHCRQ